MRVLLYGTNSKNIEELVKKLGFEVANSNPDVVISYGGDGTLLSGEREFPGIPKLPIRNSQFCHKCSKHKDEILLQNLLEGKLKLKEYKKLHTKTVERKELFALNDFIIRNEHPSHAIRFKILYPSFIVDEDPYIGDGIVVSTPFGSTGYFKSITGEDFKYGFGVAFNNTTEKEGPIYLDQDKIDRQDGFTYLDFELVRGKAILTYDNSPEIYHIPEGEGLAFELSIQVAKIYEDTSLRCPNCQVQR